MTFTTVKHLSFEEYLLYDDGTDNRYELVDEELVLVNPPTGQHSFILKFLERTIDQEISRLGLSWVSLRGSGIRTGVNNSRLPDLVVMTADQFNEIFDKSAVLETPALLAIEVVNPGSGATGYRYKRTEYAAARTAEYWIVDMFAQKVSVLTLVEGLYEAAEFQGEVRIISQTFPELSLSAKNILEARN
jgi:Uma2 family endonuclease